MKVLLINGSPKKEGCTYTALKEVADELEKVGEEIGVTVKIQREEIFTKMHRI